MEFVSIFQLDLRHQIPKDEMYVQIKDKLQHQILEKKYEGYKLEEDELITYMNIIYIPNVANLRRIVMDEIHQAPHSGHPRYPNTIATTRKWYFWLSIFLSA